MDIHECKQCGSRFVYCRKCVFRPVRYKDAGFCSKECYEASKNVVKPVVEEIIIEEAIVENNSEHSIEDVEPIEEETCVEVDAEESSFVETPITTVAESTIKNETNTYKKKKNKYQYTSSL